VDAIRSDEKSRPLGAAIAETYFDPARGGTDLRDLSAEADIGALPYELI